MRDPDLLAQGNDAPAGSADAPEGARVGIHGPRLHKLARVVTAGAAGSTVSPLDRESYATATNRGYGDAMGRGIELALTLVVMGALGWGLDRLLGTDPIFTLLFAVLGFAGITVKLWLGYDLEMRRHDDGAIWSRGRDGAGHGRADLAGNGLADTGRDTIEP